MTPRPERLRIPDRFTIIPAGSGEFRFHSLSFSLAVRDSSDELISHLLPLIDGQRSVDDIVGELNSFDDESVRQTLDYLLEAGALELGDDVGPLSSAERRRFEPQIAFFSHFVPPAGTPALESDPASPRTGLDYQARIKASHVAVFGLGRIGSEIVRALSLAGLGKITAVDSEKVTAADLRSDAWYGPKQEGLSRTEAAGDLVATLDATVDFVTAPEPADIDELRELLEDCDFAVLCRDHFNPAEYDRFNEAALAAKTLWTSARLAGFEFHIGPTVIPYETSCYKCADLRQKSNLPDFSEYRLVEDFLSTSQLRPEALAFTPGSGLVALEVLKGITWFTAPVTCSHVYSLNLLTMESKLHPVLKIPRCPACGRPAQPQPTIHAWQRSTTDVLP